MANDAVTKRYRVKPGQKVKLKEWNPSDKSLFNMSKEESLAVMDGLRTDLKLLQQKLYAQGKHKLLVVIQAMDTGGKDGCVRHVFSSVDPQGIFVTPFKKPSEEELAHDFLWRVHEKVPAKGEIAVFNRSHYEDIIAVRVKEIYPKSVWEKRYRHVKDFEKMLVDEGTVILKFFLNISKDEQKERLQARLDNPEKHWKFNPDDLKDRARWDEFMKVYEDVLEKTSTDDSPWFVVPSNRKWHRNLCVATIVIEALRELEMNFPEPTWKAADMQVK